jgi:hypothetical protein
MLLREPDLEEGAQRGGLPVGLSWSMAAAPVSPVTLPLTHAFLEWVATGPRTYGEAMEVWRTSCPRFSIWEDALEAGFVRVERVPGAPMGGDLVVLTAEGEAVLKRARS